MAESTAQEGGKKRKRTGKQREEAKKAAIQAQLAEERSIPAVKADVKEDNQPEASAVKEEPSPSGPDFDKIASRIPQALKTLHTTFKQSKSFEVRRLVKKIKFLRTKDGSSGELADLEAQLALISHIPLDPIIQSHLRLKLSRHPLLKSTPLPENVTSLLSTPEAPSTSDSEKVRGKVENRLCSSKIVSETVKTVLAWTVGEEGAKLVKTKSAKSDSAVPTRVGGQPRKVEEDDDENNEEDSDDEDPDPSRKTPRGLENVADDEESDDELAQEDMRADEAGWESGSVSDGEGDDGFASIAPASSDEEDEGSDDSDISIPKPSKKPKPSEPAKQSRPAKGRKEPVTSSTFLPSLSHGFVMGDSDSDPDLDPDVDGAGLVGRKGAERKNRRGQRARQAIWEKKYGKNAKHVVKAREAEKTKEREKKFGPSDKGWGAKNGAAPRAVAGPSGEKDGQATSKPAGRPALPTVAHSAAVASKAAVATGNTLHPSWEAARLRKQKEMAAAPKAQKIVFD